MVKEIKLETEEDNFIFWATHTLWDRVIKEKAKGHRRGTMGRLRLKELERALEYAQKLYTDSYPYLPAPSVQPIDSSGCPW